MPKIQCLDPHVADLIAAGEVVERPASVVKELVENAIDAGATSVTVSILGGGLREIRVTDDGCGIAPEEAETAFLRHATSKLRGPRDLEAIGTLGFRGEALAAIAAVSKVELLTRRSEDEMGTQLLLDGGVLRMRQETGCPAGTTMVVRELFYNTPARLKFMKRDASEGAAVFAVVQHIALSHPELSLRFLREERQDLLTPGDGQLRSAVYAVLGRSMALGFLPCEGSEGALRVEGFVSRPVCCRGSRGYQHFFVNGRYVKSKTMTAALEEGYNNTKMVGKFPACVLHITVPLGAVDVNVHPAKTEVKFSDEKGLFQLVLRAVRGALAAESGHPQAELGARRPAAQADPSGLKKPDYFQKMTAQEYRHADKKGENGIYTLRDSSPSAAWSVPRLVPVVPRPFRPPEPAAELRDMDLEIHTERPARTAAFSAALERRERERLSERAKSGQSRESADAPAPEQSARAGRKSRRAKGTAEPTPVTPVTEELTAPSQPAPPLEPSTPAPAAAEPTVPVTEERPAPSQPATLPEPEQQVLHTEAGVPVAQETPAWRMAGEVLDTYIIVEQGERVFFIDKHAAHERMNFDRLKARDYQPMPQVLLTPMTLNLPPEEGAALLAHKALLERFGFEVEEFGGGAVLVRQVPDYLSEGEVENTLSELAQRLLTTGTADPSAARDEVLHTMACKSAIKGGWKNDRRELEAVARAVMSGQVRYCPHGRPVAVELTRKQLEKQFKRT